MITLLVGDDSYAIEQEIAQVKSKINPIWKEFNLHRFSAQDLEEAISIARTAPFGDSLKLVIVEDCNLRQFGEEGLAILQCLSHLPQSTHLIFTAASIDKRLKVTKHLLKFGKLKEFTLIPPWRKDLITNAIKSQAKALSLSLSKDVVSYLAEAIGNDTTRVAAELQKLAVYGNGKRIPLSAVKSLIPCTTQTNLQLATAVRDGKTKTMARLLNELLARGEYPLVIVATLMTQFRTWLWVKTAIEQGMRKDTEIAKLCQIGNPKRLYYLRQEVKGVKLEGLIQAVSQLLELDVSLKRGASPNVILPTLLSLQTCLVKPLH